MHHLTLRGVNSISHLDSHADRMSRSDWGVELSSSLSSLSRVRYRAVSSAYRQGKESGPGQSPGGHRT